MHLLGGYKGSSTDITNACSPASAWVVCCGLYGLLPCRWRSHVSLVSSVPNKLRVVNIIIFLKRLGDLSFSRAYLTFKSLDRLTAFARAFDGHKFRNSEGYLNSKVCSIFFNSFLDQELSTQLWLSLPRFSRRRHAESRTNWKTRTWKVNSSTNIRLPNQ